MELHDYQRRAVKHLHDHPRAALFLDMGLGKTATVLSALQTEHLPALVIAPLRVAQFVWPTEAAKWRPDLSIATAIGPPAKRIEALNTQADIVVISQSTIKDIQPGHRFKTVVLDESSMYKSPSSQRSKHARRITKTPVHVWALTGTPSPNSLMDVWNQVFLLDKGERLDTAFTRFQQRYFTETWRLPNGIVGRWDIRPGAEQRIHDLISDICLHMSADDHLDLPPVTYNNVTVPLPKFARKDYDDLRKDLVASIDMLDGTRQFHTAANAAVLSGKLSQITAGILYNDDQSGAYTKMHDAKLDALEEIQNGTGSPLLVFYRFRAERDRIQERFPWARTLDSKNALADWNAGKAPMLLAHPASAGFGLNLQSGGHTIVWSSLPWSLSDYEQANARLARQGQTQPVVIHHLVCPQTVDGRILDALSGKASVQDALLSALKEGQT